MDNKPNKLIEDIHSTADALLIAKQSEVGVVDFPPYVQGAGRVRKYLALGKERLLYLFFDCPPNVAEFSAATILLGSGINLFFATDALLKYRLEILNIPAVNWIAYLLVTVGVLKLLALFFGGYRFRAYTSLANCMAWIFFAATLVIPPITWTSLATFYLAQAFISARNYWYLRSLSEKITNGRG